MNKRFTVFAFLCCLLPGIWHCLNVNYIGKQSFSWHSIIISESGTLWTSGNNLHGQLGDGTTSHSNVMIQIGTSTWANAASGAYHSMAIKTDGTLWAWGRNYDGQICDGTFVNRLSPNQVGSGNNWKQVAAGSSHFISLKSDGTIWGCGYNGQGQMGDGSHSGRTS